MEPANTVQLEVLDRVAVVRLRRGKGNALNPELVEDLLEVLRRPELVEDSDCMILTGDSGFFSAGLDLVELGEFGESRMLAFLDRLQGLLQMVFVWNRPVIAAIDGPAVAGGCLLAMCADWRVASRERTKMGLNEMALGVPLPQAGLEILSSQLTARAWSEVVYGAALHDAESSLRLGLADEVVDAREVLDRASERARAWAAHPPLAFHRMKAARRDPVLLRIREKHEQRQQEWVNVWFSADAQARLREARARLLARHH